MTFILGTSRLTYDHFGDYPLLQSEATEQTPAGIIGDSCSLGDCSLGTFMLCEEKQAVEIESEVL